jgi:hypothetical protein
MKICRKCKLEKNFEEFQKDKSRKDGHEYICKKCKNKNIIKELLTKEEKILRNRLYNKKYRSKFKEEIAFNKKKWYEKNKEILKEKGKAYCKNNKQSIKEKHKLWRERNKEKLFLQNKLWRLNNKDKLKEYRKEYTKERRKILKNKLIENCRSRIYWALRGKNISKDSKTITLLGCSENFLKTHLESKFQPGMAWENYGQFGWHIDHIIPLSSAKTKEEIYKLCHYTNLQPLWWQDNIEKSNKIL